MVDAIDTDGGWLLLTLLSLTGWETAVVAGLSSGVTVIGYLGTTMVSVHGETLAHVATDFFKACSAVAYAERLTPPGGARNGSHPPEVRH